MELETRELYNKFRMVNLMDDKDCFDLLPGETINLDATTQFTLGTDGDGLIEVNSEIGPISCVRVGDREVSDVAHFTFKGHLFVGEKEYILIPPNAPCVNPKYDENKAKAPIDIEGIVLEEPKLKVEDFEYKETIEEAPVEEDFLDELSDSEISSELNLELEIELGVKESVEIKLETDVSKKEVTSKKMSARTKIYLRYLISFAMIVACISMTSFLYGVKIDEFGSALELAQKLRKSVLSTKNVKVAKETVREIVEIFKAPKITKRKSFSKKKLAKSKKYVKVVPLIIAPKPKIVIKLTDSQVSEIYQLIEVLELEARVDPYGSLDQLKEMHSTIDNKMLKKRLKNAIRRIR